VKLLVTGSRHWLSQAMEGKTKILSELMLIREKHSLVTLIHGGAPGADSFAAHIALRWKWGVRPYPANWAQYQKKAGPIRNRLMLLEEHKPDMQDPIDLCLAFPLPGGKGTQDMMGLCVEARIPVKEVLWWP